MAFGTSAFRGVAMGHMSLVIRIGMIVYYCQGSGHLAGGVHFDK